MIFLINATESINDKPTKTNKIY